MAFTLSGTPQGTNSTAASSLTTPSWSATAGDLIVAVIASFSTTVSSVTDSAANSFTVQAVVNTSGGGHLYIAYLLSLPVSSATYTVKANFSGSNECSLAAGGFTPPASTTVTLDQTNTATGTSSAPSVSVSSVTAASLVVGGTSFDATTVETAGTNFTLAANGLQPSNGDPSTHQPLAFEYWLNATGGTTTVAFGTSVSGAWAIRGTSFKAVAAGVNAPFVFPTQGPSYAI